MANIIRNDISLYAHNIAIPLTASQSGPQVQLVPSAYAGTPAFYFEIVGQVASGTCTVTLRRSGTTTDDATISLTETTKTRKRAVFTNTGTREYFVNLSGGTTPQVFQARIIVLQDIGASSSTTGTAAQFSIQPQQSDNNTSPGTAPNGMWLFDSSLYDGTLAWTCEVVWSKNGTMQDFTATLQQDDGSYNFSDLATVVSASSAAGPTRSTVSFTPTSGRRLGCVFFISNSMETYTVHATRIKLAQTGTITKTVAPHHILGSLGSSGLQGARTLWDPAEWGDLL